MFLRCGLQCYAQVFACSYSYVFTLTIPNSILTYWAFPAEVAAYGNAFAVSRAQIHSSCQIRVGVGSSVDVHPDFQGLSLSGAESGDVPPTKQVFPASGLRNAAIILMIGHQMVAFLFFIMPVR